MSRLKFVALFFGGCFVLVAIGFSTAVYFWKEAVIVPTPPLPAVTTATEQTSNTGRGPLAAIQVKFASSSAECELAFADDAFVSEGSLFVSRGQVRIDALLRGSTSTVVSLVAEGQRIVAWRSDSSPLTPEILDLEAPTQLDMSSPLSLWSLPAGYTCHAWVVDRSVFTPPVL